MWQGREHKDTQLASFYSYTTAEVLTIVQFTAKHQGDGGTAK